MWTRSFVKNIKITITKLLSKSQYLKFDDKIKGKYAKSWSKKGLYLFFICYLVAVKQINWWCFKTFHFTLTNKMLPSNKYDSNFSEKNRKWNCQDINVSETTIYVNMISSFAKTYPKSMNHNYQLHRVCASSLGSNLIL